MLAGVVLLSQVAIDASMEVAVGNPELQCWLFEKPFTSMYLRRGGNRQTWVLKFEICHRMAVRSLILVGCLNSEMFGVLPKDRHQHFVTVSCSPFG